MTSTSTTNTTDIKPARRKTIYEVLYDKLGREPTHKELCDDVKRIIAEAQREREANTNTRGR